MLVYKKGKRLVVDRIKLSVSFPYGFRIQREPFLFFVNIILNLKQVRKESLVRKELITRTYQNGRIFEHFLFWSKPVWWSCDFRDTPFSVISHWLSSTTCCVYLRTCIFITVETGLHHIASVFHFMAHSLKKNMKWYLPPYGAGQNSI